MPRQPGIDPKQEGGAFGPSAKETRQTRRKPDVKLAKKRAPKSARSTKRATKKKPPMTPEQRAALIAKFKGKK